MAIRRISTALAVESLVESVEAYNEFEANRARALAERNEAIRDAAQFIPQLRLVKITGLSREQLYRIRGEGVKAAV